MEELKEISVVSVEDVEFVSLYVAMVVVGFLEVG